MVSRLLIGAASNEGHYGWPLDMLDLFFLVFWVGLREFSKTHLHQQHTETECVHFGRVLARRTGFRSSIEWVTRTSGGRNKIHEVGRPIVRHFRSPPLPTTSLVFSASSLLTTKWGCFSLPSLIIMTDS